MNRNPPIWRVVIVLTALDILSRTREVV